MGIAVIVLTGICSIVVFQNGRERYGNFGGLAHFPLFWLAGFTIYPGYICTLLTYPCRFTPNGGMFEALLLNPGEMLFFGVIATLIAAYYAGTLYFAFKRRPNWIGPIAKLYFLSVLLNFLNFLLVSLASL